MRRIVLIILPMLLLMGRQCLSQSLADTARQLQRQKPKSGTAAKKVFTTDDLSTSPDPKPATASDSNKKGGANPSQTADAAGVTPEMCARAIRAMKDRVAHLQAAADDLKTMPAEDINKLSTGVEKMRYWQERNNKQQLAAQLPAEQKKLEELQDAARKAGLPPEVYNPQ